MNALEKTLGQVRTSISHIGVEGIKVGRGIVTCVQCGKYYTYKAKITRFKQSINPEDLTLKVGCYWEDRGYLSNHVEDNCPGFKFKK